MFCGEHCCSADPPPDPPPNSWSSLTCFHCSGGRGGRPASSLFTCSGLTSGHPGLEEVGCLGCFSSSFLRSLFPQISPAGEGGKRGSPIFRQPRAIRTVRGRTATWVVEGRSGCWVSRSSVEVFLEGDNTPGVPGLVQDVGLLVRGLRCFPGFGCAGWAFFRVPGVLINCCRFL